MKMSLTALYTILIIQTIYTLSHATHTLLDNSHNFQCKDSATKIKLASILYTCSSPCAEDTLKVDAPNEVLGDKLALLLLPLVATVPSPHPQALKHHVHTQLHDGTNDTTEAAGTGMGPRPRHTGVHLVGIHFW